MKAFQIMMVLLLFNFSVFMLQASEIYSFGMSPIYTNALALQAITIAAVLAAVGTGVAVSIVSKTKVAIEVAIYALFAGAFWGVFAASMIIIDGVASKVADLAPGVIFFFNVILLTITTILFVIGIMQMVVGGWKSYE